LQAEVDRSLGDAHQLDVPSMGVEQRPNPFKGLMNSRIEILGMEPVKQHQAAHEFVLRQRIDQGKPRVAGLRREVEDDFKGCAVEVQEALDDLPDLPSRTGISELIDLLEKRRDLGDAIAEVMVVRVQWQRLRFTGVTERG
jgi:hypothetical protein